MSKKLSRIIGAVMLFIAAVFVVIALTHPNASFPWSNAVTYTLYILYAIVMLFLLIAPFKK